MRTAGSAFRTRIQNEKPESHPAGVQALTSFDLNKLSIPQGGALSIFRNVLTLVFMRCKRQRGPLKFGCLEPQDRPPRRKPLATVRYGRPNELFHDRLRVYNGIGVVKQNFSVEVAVGFFSRLPPCGIRFGLKPTKARLVESHGGPLGFYHSSMRSRCAFSPARAAGTMIHRSTSPPSCGEARRPIRRSIPPGARPPRYSGCRTRERAARKCGACAASSTNGSSGGGRWPLFATPLDRRFFKR